MKKKLIAIGNRMMGDDGIGIWVTEAMGGYLKQQGFEIIIGETDVDYCLGCIEAGDYVIVLDGIWGKGEPGDVVVTSLSEIDLRKELSCWQHQPSLLHFLGLYQKRIAGVLIGIEVQDVGFQWGLSDCLQALFPEICRQVMEKIEIVLRGKAHA